MELRYKCLVIDHDDTSVDSTVKINYPAYLLIMKELRPNSDILTSTEFIRCASKGSFIENYYKKELGFSDSEVKREIEMWTNYAKDKNPDFYDGFLELLRKYKMAGGHIVVASHSFDHMVSRHYTEFQKGMNDKIHPDIIFGWSDVKELTKPHPNVIYESISRLNAKGNSRLNLSDVLVLDDLKTGFEMAHSANVDFAWAGWGHDIPEIKEYMKENAKYTFSNIRDFERFIFIN